MMVSWVESVDREDGEERSLTYIAFLHAHHVDLDAVVSIGKRA